jgi:hypothetical protein
LAEQSAPTTEVEFETSTSRFVMRNIHPTAAQALRDFAAQAVADGNTVWFCDSQAGNA